MKPTPAMIATQQLYEVNRKLDDSSSAELRVQVGILASLIVIADRLKDIEASLDLTMDVRVVEEVQVRNVG